MQPKTGQPATGLFVALHGWGANAADLSGLAPYLGAEDYYMLFPDAPFPHPYAPGGFMWYDLPAQYSFQSQPDFDRQPDLQTSRDRLLNWLQTLEQATGIPLSRTVLAGFSQGGAMTLDVGSRLPLAALMVMSGYLHAPLTPQEPASEASLPPVLVVHGRQDPVVPLAAAHQVRDRLTELGADVEYHELDMGHEISMNALNLMQTFMQRVTSSLGQSA
ncbi:MAG: alpha/beta hydrolase [Elainellaceae cyanobacterium]